MSGLSCCALQCGSKHTWAAFRVLGDDSEAASRSKLLPEGSSDSPPDAMDRSGGMADGMGVAGPDRVVPGRRRVGLPARLCAGVRLGVVCGVWGMLVGADASRPSCLCVERGF